MTEEEKPRMMRTPFDKPELKEKFEEKLKPFEIKEIMETGKLSQEIPVKDDITIVFCTLSAGEDIFVEKFINDRLEETNELYIKVHLPVQLAAATKRYGGVPLIDEPEVDFSEVNKEKYKEQLDKKVEKVLGWNVQFLTLLTTHLLWFNDRVNKFLQEQFIESFENF